MAVTHIANCECAASHVFDRQFVVTSLREVVSSEIVILLRGSSHLLP